MMGFLVPMEHQRQKNSDIDLRPGGNDVPMPHQSPNSLRDHPNDPCKGGYDRAPSKVFPQSEVNSIFFML